MLSQLVYVPFNFFSKKKKHKNGPCLRLFFFKWAFRTYYKFITNAACGHGVAQTFNKKKTTRKHNRKKVRFHYTFWKQVQIPSELPQNCMTS